MPYVDLFSKYYSFDKLPQDNKYYSLKKDNYEKANQAYDNNCIELQSFPIRALIQTTDFFFFFYIMSQLHSQLVKHTLRSLK
jgi:hypothetical protein